jgi:hypothetical protein
MGFSEWKPGEGWGEPTDDTIWQFADALDISRFERFGLTDATLFRLDVLRRNADIFGVKVDGIGSLPAGGSGCWMFLYGFNFAHRVEVNGNAEPAEISLATCDLDLPETWTPRFQGQDTAGCWSYLLLKIASIEGIGFAGTEGMFEVPH